MRGNEKKGTKKGTRNKKVLSRGLRGMAGLVLAAGLLLGVAACKGTEPVENPKGQSGELEASRPTETETPSPTGTQGGKTPTPSPAGTQGGKTPTPNPAGAQGGEGAPENSTPTGVPEPTPFPDRDLEGMEIVIGDWWSFEDAGFLEILEQDYSFEEYYKEITEKYHFEIRTEAVADWGEMPEVCVDSIMRGEPAAQVFALDYRFLGKPFSKGLFYDLASLQELDFTEEKWNPAVKAFMTRGSSIYGMNTGVSAPAGGVLWNKRLFEEAGLDPDLPYELQKNGEWTWSKFEELCEVLTRDTNGDGVTDVYATASPADHTLRCLVTSTGKDFFAKDGEGRLFNNCKDADVLRAMELAARLYNKGYEKPMPEYAPWNWFVEEFRNGRAAMCFDDAGRLKGIFGERHSYMEEGSVGFVLPPKPDGQEDYHSYVYDDVYIIPSCYDAETASKIAFGFNVYTAFELDREIPVEDRWQRWKYGIGYPWIDYGYSEYTWRFGERMGEESMARFFEGTCTHYLLGLLLPDRGAALWQLFDQYPFAGTTPEKCVEEVWDAWQEVLDEVNGWR